MTICVLRGSNDVEKREKRKEKREKRKEKREKRKEKREMNQPEGRPLRR